MRVAKNNLPYTAKYSQGELNIIAIKGEYFYFITQKMRKQGKK